MNAFTREASAEPLPEERRVGLVTVGAAVPPEVGATTADEATPAADDTGGAAAGVITLWCTPAAEGVLEEARGGDIVRARGEVAEPVLFSPLL
jgi:hypothetical protein